MLALLALLPLLLTAEAAPTKRFNRVQIVSGRDGKCLGAATKPYVGAPVASVDCVNTGYATYWDINPGSGSVILSGTDLALDAGSTPGNNGALKVWTSYPGLYQQTWFLTGDNRIAITGGNQCLDEGDNGIQTYQCTTGNTNQVFKVQGELGTPPTSSSVAPPPASSSTSANPPGSTGPVDPAGKGRRLHPNGQNNLCVTVQNGYAAQGAEVAISACMTPSFDNEYTGNFELFDLPAGGKGNVRLHGTNKCLDAGSNPANGGGLKIWDCYEGLFQQTWDLTSGSIKLSSNQCVDVVEGSGPDQTKPYNSLKDLQIYQCYDGNTNQKFNTYP